jgi:hypothetical protein
MILAACIPQVTGSIPGKDIIFKDLGFFFLSSLFEAKTV